MKTDAGLWILISNGLISLYFEPTFLTNLLGFEFLDQAVFLFEAVISWDVDLGFELNIIDFSIFFVFLIDLTELFNNFMEDFLLTFEAILENFDKFLEFDRFSLCG